MPRPMARRPRPRAPFVVTVAVATLASGCGGSLSSDGTGGTGGGTTNPPPPECPATLPSPGSGCAVEGLSCSVVSHTDPCGTPITYAVSCVAGAWSVELVSPSSCNPPPPPLESCPDAEPAAGGWCNVVEGKSCSYPGLCCFATYTCSANIWLDVSPSCNPPQPVCPSAPPAPGAACDPCAPSFAPCSYDSCGDGGVLTSASCENGAWNVQLEPCGPAADGGV